MKIEIYLEAGEPDNAITFAKALTEVGIGTSVLEEIAEHLLIYCNHKERENESK